MQALFARVSRVAVAIAAAVGCATSAGAATLTFEELDPGAAAQARFESYGGFTWSGAWYVAHPATAARWGPGPWLGTIGLVAVYARGGTEIVATREDHGRFTFGGAYITAAVNWYESLRVEGWRDGAAAYSQVITTSWDRPYWFEFGYVDVDAIRIVLLGSDVVLDDFAVTVAADTAPPTLELVEVPALTAASGVVVAGRALEPDGSASGLWGAIEVAGVRVPISFDVATGAFREWVPLADGANTILVEIADRAGNVVREVLAVTRDALPPSLEIVAPAAADAAGVRGTIEVAVGVSDAATAVESVQFAVDGGPAIPGAGGPIWSASLDLGGLADGTHVISAVATDVAGNVASAWVNVVVDATPPAVSLLSPSPGAQVRGALSVSAAASDATSGVRSIRLLVNGAPIGGCDAAACEVTFETAQLPYGPFVVAAVATDVAGNEAFAQAMVVADNTAPSRFLIAPAPGQVVAGEAEVVVAVGDPGFAWAECFAGGVSLGRSDDPSFRRAIDLTRVLDGPLDVVCIAADLAGNVAEEQSTVVVRHWTVVLDPRVLVTRATPGSGSVVTVFVEGRNVALLAPASEHGMALVVPGGAAVPLVPRPASEQVSDADGDGVPDLTLKFERAALLSAIRGGVAAGLVARGAAVEVQLLGDGRVLGTATVEVR